MFSHIHSATVAVADQSAALDFYLNVFGWEKVLDVPMGEGNRFTTVVIPGAKTQLALSPASWFSAESMPGKTTGIALIVHDIDAAYKTLSERGVRFKQAPEVMPWGQKATWMYDLDDNEFFLHEA